jgi:hypothetical protein
MTSSKKKSDSAQEARAREDLAIDCAPPSNIEAVRINEVLHTKYYDAVGTTWWWNNPNSRLGGRTPHQVWLGETKPSPETIEVILMAADAAPMMGRAT